MAMLRRGGGSSHAHSPDDSAVITQQSPPSLSLFPAVSVTAACIITFIVAVLVYANSVSGDFVLDDRASVVNNPQLRPEMPLSELLWRDYWGVPLTSVNSHRSYRGITVLTFRLNYIIHGLHPLGFHLVNILLHAVCSVLVVAVAALPAFHGADDHDNDPSVAPLVAGLLFAIHPIHVEAVANITGRAELLSTMFALSGIYIFLSSTLFMSSSSAKKIIPMKSSKQKEFRTSMGPLPLSLFCCVLATLSKETGFTSVGVMFSYVLIWQLFHGSHATLDRSLRQGAVIAVTAAVVLCLRLAMQGFQIKVFVFSWVENPAAFHSSILVRGMSYLYLSFRHYSLLLAPVTLCADYSGHTVPLVLSMWDQRFLCAILFFLVALFTVIWILMHKSYSERYLIAIVLCIFPFIPSSNIFLTVGFVIAERVMYFPSVGFCIFIGLLCNDFGRVHRPTATSRKAIVIICVCVVTLLTLRTLIRNNDWKSEEHLWKSAITAAPNNPYAFFNLGASIGKEEQAVKSNDRVDQQIAMYQRAIDLAPGDMYDAHNNLAVIYKKQKNFKTCLYHLEQSLKIRPNYASALQNMATTLIEMGNYNEALRTVEQLLALEPEHWTAVSVKAVVLSYLKRFDESQKLFEFLLMNHPLLPGLEIDYAGALERMGKTQEAMLLYEKVLGSKPTDDDLYISLCNAGRTSMRQGDFQRAFSYFDKAVKTDSKRDEAYGGLGISFLQFGNDYVQKAIDALQSAIKINGNHAEYYSNLGAALYKNDDIDGAIVAWEQALKIDPEFADAKKNIGVAKRARQRRTKVDVGINIIKH